MATTRRRVGTAIRATLVLLVLGALAAGARANLGAGLGAGPGARSARDVALGLPLDAEALREAPAPVPGPRPMKPRLPAPGDVVANGPRLVAVLVALLPVLLDVLGSGLQPVKAVEPGHPIAKKPALQLWSWLQPYANSQ